MVLLILLIIFVFINNFLILLIRLEFILIFYLFLSILIGIKFYIEWIFLYLLVIGVCESVIGISLIIRIVHNYGTQNIKILNLKW